MLSAVEGQARMMLVAQIQYLPGVYDESDNVSRPQHCYRSIYTAYTQGEAHHGIISQCFQADLSAEGGQTEILRGHPGGDSSANRHGRAYTTTQ
jgi:hypothetical protein